MCFCRVFLGDVFGAIQDGILVMFGFTAVFEVAALPTSMYGGACIFRCLTDTFVFISTLLDAKESHAGKVQSQQVLVTHWLYYANICAPFLSIFGALLALRLYKNMSNMSGAKSDDFSPLPRGISYGTNDEAGSWWPSPAPAPLPPLATSTRLEVPPGPAFKGIFGVLLDSPSITERSPRSVWSEDRGAVL